MFEAGSVGGFDAEEVLTASFRAERRWAPPREWIACSVRTPWGVHERSLSDGACRRCGWTPKRM